MTTNTPLKSAALSWMRERFFTPNTIRYRVEWPRLEEAFKQIGKTGTLFDGGAGSGEFARRALVGGYCERVIALEPDSHNFERLQGNLGRYPSVNLLQASLLNIPLPDNSVDMVMCTQVIEHIKEHEQVAKEFDRILKPGGFALITVPHPPEPFPNDDHVREGYTAEDLKALFEPLGMKSLRTDYFLTKDTTNRMLRALQLPSNGVFLPLAWVDMETDRSAKDRQACEPFGILMLFQKAA